MSALEKLIRQVRIDPTGAAVFAVAVLVAALALAEFWEWLSRV